MRSLPNDDLDFLKENPFLFIGIGCVFLVLFIAGMIIALATNGSFWTTGWAIIPGGVLLAFGITQYLQKQNYYKITLAVLKNYEGKTVPLSQVAKELNFENEMRLFRKILLELRGSGKLVCQIDKGMITIQMVHSEAPKVAPQPIFVAPSTDQATSASNTVYCPFCGVENLETAIFCKNCGQAFQ